MSGVVITIIGVSIPAIALLISKDFREIICSIPSKFKKRNMGTSGN
jgi:hypothetical protein